MYSIDELKELIKAFDNSTLCAMELTSAQGESLKLNRELQTAVSLPGTVQSAQTVQPSAVLSAERPKEEELSVISSPMVGVFYESPSPDSSPFVTVGQTVNKGDTVCIVEAMKLMNEITAEKSGDIVEFGQPLFKLR